MKGKVLGFDVQTGSGVISGTDEERYSFVSTALGAGVTILRPGQDVDFVVKEDGDKKVAIEIFPVKTAVSANSGEKTKVPAALLAFFLGVFGAHKFYLGNNGAGAIHLIVWVLGWLLFGIPSSIIWIISVVEAILYLTKSDDEFYETYVVNKKAWF